MSRSDHFIDHLQELMASWAPVSAHKMFGGYGLKRDGLMFALVANDTLYFKADAQNQAEFEAAGCTPFVYQSKSRKVQLSYRTAPAECLESGSDMLRWCRLGWEAALRAQAAQQAKRKAPRKAAAKKTTANKSSKAAVRRKR